jgi:hypothetical protein
MGASEVVADIADKISRKRAPLTPREAFLIYLLQGMPKFRDCRCLNLWDDCYKEIAPEENLTDTERLIDATFWLAGEFMYSNVNEARARDYFFKTLQPLLRQFGIETYLTGDDSLEDW